MFSVAEHYEGIQSDYMTAPFYVVVCPDAWRVIKSRGAVSRNAAERISRSGEGHHCAHTHAVVALWPPDKATSDALHHAMCYGTSCWDGFDRQIEVIWASAKVAYVPEGDYFCALSDMLPKQVDPRFVQVKVLLTEALVALEELMKE